MYSKLLDGLLRPEERESEPQLIRQEELIFNKQRKIELRPQIALLSALSIFRRSECPKVRQLPRVLEDGLGILMQDTVHVVVLLGKQPFQEANVATPSRDEQCNIGRLLSSLQREGWEGVKEEVRKLPGSESPGSYLRYNPHLWLTSLGIRSAMLKPLTVGWGEGIVCCVEAKNGGMNGIYLGSWA